MYFSLKNYKCVYLFCMEYFFNFALRYDEKWVRRRI